MPLKPERLGWLSVILASTCCLFPLLAIGLGLGSIGLGSFFGRFEPWLDLGGVLVVIAAWLYFMHERRRVYALGSTIKGERRTLVALSVATVLVVLFAGSALVSHLLPPSSPMQTTFAQSATIRASGASTTARVNYPRAVLAVTGMECYACVPEIEHSLNKVPGVHFAQVDFHHQTVTVEYDPAKATAAQLVSAVKSVGYDAKVAD
ncbi:MAG TPA: heavy metal-associated domain-containing protein [Candidatus Binataceae bacterium]|nr:heavy metal-associated domain-containing protein [Candidatus Binataceae bacterium]